MWPQDLAIRRVSTVPGKSSKQTQIQRLDIVTWGGDRRVTLDSSFRKFACTAKAHRAVTGGRHGSREGLNMTHTNRKQYGKRGSTNKEVCRFNGWRLRK